MGLVKGPTNGHFAWLKSVWQTGNDSVFFFVAVPEIPDFFDGPPEGADMFNFRIAILDYFPRLVALASETILGIALLFKSHCNRRNLKRMRIAVLIKLATLMSGLFIACQFFSEDEGDNILNLLGAM